MNSFVKVLLTVLALAIIVSVVGGIYSALTGDYFSNASLITSALVLTGSALLIGLLIYGVKKMWLPVLLLVAVAGLGSCNYAKSNQQVVVSTDCGKTWDLIEAGQHVPTGTGNYCYMKVVMPNYPMQGDSRFIGNLSEKVRVKVHIDYDYSIVEPLSFIKQAKYLGKANASADTDDALDPNAFETAENTVIDKRIREVAKDLFLDEDIVDLDQQELEDILMDNANKILEPLGVKLNFITLTFDLDEQTRQAIDVVTAMKIYKSKGYEELGAEIIKAKAGATKVTVENNAPSVTQSEE